MPLKLLACQIQIPTMTTNTEKYDHLARVVSNIDHELRHASVDIIVLPELSNIDYSRPAFDSLPELAEPLDGPTFHSFAELARRHQTAVVFGLATVKNEEYYITQAVIDKHGKLVGHYDKIHIAQYGASMEKEYFSRGSQILVFEINGIRISPIICYDIRIPELFRTLCIEHSVQLVLHCGAYARDESFYSWHQFAITRAMENQCYLLSLNRAGNFYGESLFCPPWIDESHPETPFPITEFFKIISIDTNVIDEVRYNYTFLQDRLADYSKLKLVEIKSTD